MNIPNRKNQFEKICTYYYLISIPIGFILFYFFRYQFYSGFGLVMSLISLVQIIGVTKSENESLDRNRVYSVETKLSVFLLLSSLLGIILIILNKYLAGHSFIYGIGTAMSIFFALAYVIELIRRYIDLT